MVATLCERRKKKKKKGVRTISNIITIDMRRIFLVTTTAHGFVMLLTEGCI